MKLSLNLQCVNYKGTGIANFANEMALYLQDNSDFQLSGCYVQGRVTNGDYKRFRFPIYKLFLPRLPYIRGIKKPLPIPYRLISKEKADINLYFTWNITRFRHQGLTIATIHDLIALRTEMENSNIVKKQTYELGYTCRHCDYLITVSNNSKQDIIKTFHFPEEKIEVIPNGVHFDVYNKPVKEEKINDIRKRYDLPQQFILYFGAYRKHKNLERLVEAYSRLPEDLRSKYPLVLTNCEKMLGKLVEQLGVSGDILFTGFVEESDKVAFYQMAHLVCYISLYEGFGIPIIEAQAAGTPVVASNCSSIPEVVGDTAMLVNPWDVDSISEGIGRMLTDKKLANSMVERGMENARNYSWEKAGEKLKDFLTRVYNMEFQQV